MNRIKREIVGKETVEINEKGWYENQLGQKVSIELELQQSIANTILIKPEDHSVISQNCADILPSVYNDTEILVVNTTTLEAAFSLLDEVAGERVMCLNFASAKRPGGGFLTGSGAQEESLARSSGLYQCLISQPEYYEKNKACKSMMYTEYMIYSPGVPVYRNDEGHLLDKSYCIDILTAPAANAKQALNRGESEADIQDVMDKRIEKVLSVALNQGCKNLVLGAWGCGVFGNKPPMIAKLFAKHLMDDGIFSKAFNNIVFAVYDRSGNENNICEFKKLFNSASLHHAEGNRSKKLI